MNQGWGFVGLGAMGGPMAANLARSGIPVTVLARRAIAADAAKAAGAHVVADTAALAKAADIVGICVNGESQVAELFEGEDGLLARARPGTLIVLHTTLAPEACLRFARSATERGLRVLDAPVSGLPMRAKSGELTIYVGGDPTDLERARPGLEAMGKTIVHMGGVAAGQITKIVTNMVTITTTAVVAEAIELGLACGLDQAALKTAMQSGSADSFVIRQFDSFQTRAVAVANGEGVSTYGQGLGLALDLARGRDLDLPLAGVAVSVLPQVLLRTARAR